MHTLAAVTALPESDLSAMVGRILPLTAVIVPFWLVRTFVGWAETFEVLPAILVVGFPLRARSIFGRTTWTATWWTLPRESFRIVATLLFLRVWKPKRIWRFEDERGEDAAKLKRGETAVVHTPGQIAKAWMPFALLSLFVLLWGLPTIKTAMGKATTPAFKTGGWEVPYLHKAVLRAQPVV